MWLLVAASSLSALGTAAPPGAGPGIEWRTRFEDARAAARKTNAPMLLEFWAGWCAPCKYMDTEVYSDPRVASAMKRVVPLRVDMDTQGVLARQYAVETIPTLVFTDSHGTELFRYAGLLEAAPMVQLLSELPADVTRINRLSAAVAADKQDAAALEALAQELRAAALYRASNQFYDRALRAQPARQQLDRRAAILIAMGRNHLELQQPTDAAKLFERCLRESGGQPWEPDSMLGLGRALLAQGRQADGRRVLESLTARYAASPAAMQAAALLAAR
jgi:thioredoxin-like negative regulator of GroEL